MAAPDADRWKEDMDQEMANLKSHNVYELVPRVPGMRTLPLAPQGQEWRLRKEQRTACCWGQSPMSYGETFSPVMRLESLHTTLALAAIRDLDIIQFDITSGYLHRTLKEEVYMEQPEGYVTPGKEDWVWRLRKGLYGFVQAGRTWNEELNAHLVSKGFTVTPKDPEMYAKNGWNDRDFAAAGFWVDGCVAIGCREQLTALEKSVDAKYRMTGLGGVRWVLGMLLERDRSARTISSTPSSSDSTPPTRPPSRRLSHREPTSPLPTRRRTRSRRWRIDCTGSL